MLCNVINFYLISTENHLNNSYDNMHDAAVAVRFMFLCYPPIMYMAENISVLFCYSAGILRRKDYIAQAI